MKSPFGEFEPQRRDRNFTYDFDELIAEHVPWLAVGSSELMRRIMFLKRDSVIDSARYRAVPVIFNQSANDMLSLLAEIRDGTGRPAMRTSRSLVEHAINMADVVTNPDLGHRYVDHLELVHLLLDKAAIGVELLPGKERKRYKRILKHNANKASRKFNNALKAYGPRFKRSWAKQNLKERADAHKLSKLYNYYRVASLVMHGAAGGVLGTTRTVQGMIVHRTGPALELCPLALLIGLKAFRTTVEYLGQHRADVQIQPALEVLDTFTRLWPEYRDGIIRIDKDLWPKTPPGETQAVLAISRRGTPRWYLHDPVVGVLIEAEAPKLDQKIEQAVNDEIAEIRSGSRDHLFGDDDHWLLMGFMYPLKAKPIANGAIIPDTALNQSYWEEIRT